MELSKHSDKPWIVNASLHNSDDLELLIDETEVEFGGFHSTEIIVSNELTHMVTLIGKNAQKSQVIKDSIDRIISIGGIIHNFEASENNLSICFSHDPLITLKTLYSVVTHHNLNTMILKENLKQITLKGNQFLSLGDRISELINRFETHSIQINSNKFVLIVDAQKVIEIVENLRKHSY